MTRLLIYGTGKIAEVAHWMFANDTSHDVVAFTNAGEFISEQEFRGLPVVAFEELPERIGPDEAELFVALGYRQHNEIRMQRYLEAKTIGYRIASYVSSRATLLGASVGENCLILEDNTIQPFVEIGDNVTLWSGNHIGHHSKVGDHTFISSHVVVSGSCTIEQKCFLGVNSTLRDNITIGERSVVGAGALVMGDCPPDSLVPHLRDDPRALTRDVL